MAASMSATDRGCGSRIDVRTSVRHADDPVMLRIPPGYRIYGTISGAVLLNAVDDHLMSIELAVQNPG